VARALAARVLFIRGADGSVGLGGGANTHAADLANMSTASGNTGWGTLSNVLATAGFIVSQITEGATNSDGCVAVSSPLDFAGMTNLGDFDLLVFGSNNARYPSNQVDAVVEYVRRGGAALFISDANFGRDWRTAANSDQDFMTRFGLAMNQDRSTYVLSITNSDFLVPGHPLLAGVQAFDGEGVSPIRFLNTPPGMRTTRVVRARSGTRDNNGVCGVNQGQGTARAVDTNDLALVTVEYGLGRVVGHFDRNTFFNTNGAGTSIARFDNRQFTLNLFSWLGEAGSVRYGAWSTNLPPGQAAFASDADGDGLANGMEYAFNASATNAADGVAFTPALTVVTNSGARLSVEFFLADPPRGDVRIEVQATGNVATNWTTLAAKDGPGAWEGGATVVEAVPVAGRRWVRVEDTVGITAADQRHLRVRAVLMVP
jgi:hypothetical protein